MRISTIILSLVMFLLFGNAISGQNCYEVIADKSGMDITPYQAELEAAACELIQTFPEEFQDSFKVYSFGFYSQHESMEYGFNAVWEKVISDIESPYYLVFGKQTDQSGVYTKFWVRLKLPTSNEFSCFDSDYYNKIEFKVAQKTKSIHELNQNRFNTFSEAEISGIEELNDWIIKIVECCDLELRNEFSCNICAWSSEESFEFLTLKDFDQESIIIIDNLPTIDSLCICSTEYNATLDIREGVSYEVVKSTVISEFYYQEDTINISLMFDELEELAYEYERNNFNFFGAISDNSAFCSNSEEAASRSFSGLSLEEIELSFNSAQVGIWIHIQYDNLDAILNVKTKGIGGNIMINCDSFPHYCDKLFRLLNKLESNSKSLYNEVTKSFCSQNELDLIIKISDLPAPISGRASPLKEVIDSKVIVCEVDAGRFHPSYYCTSNHLGYLTVAETILHECVHALLTRLVYMADGNNWVEKNSNMSVYNYNHVFIDIYNRYTTEQGKLNSALYAHHTILFKHFLRKITKTLHIYNNNFGNEYNYYWMAYNFAYKDLKLEDIRKVFEYKNNVSLEDIHLDLQLKNELLYEKIIPCLD